MKKLTFFRFLLLFFFSLTICSSPSFAQKGNAFTNLVEPVLNAAYDQSECTKDAQKLDVIIDLDINFGKISPQNVRQIVFNVELEAITNTFTHINWLANVNPWLDKGTYSVTDLGKNIYRISVNTPNGIFLKTKNANLTGATVVIVTDFVPDPNPPFHKGLTCGGNSSGFNARLEGMHVIRAVNASGGLSQYAMFSGSDALACESIKCSLASLREISEADQADFQAPTVFPNPANEMLTLRAGKESILAVEVFSLRGQRVRHSLVENKLQHDIAVGDLPTGMYLLRIRMENGVHAQKVQIMH